MILQLSRPLVFLDFETTGLDVTADRIIELAFVKMQPDGTRTSLVQRINPGIEVSKKAAKITGVHTMDATGLFWGPPLKKVGQKCAEFLGGCDLAGFNQIAFDVPLWLAECERHGIAFELGDRKQVDVRILFHTKETGWDRFLMGPRNLTAAVRHYCGRELDNAHSAEADCLATADVLLAQLERHKDLPRDVPGLHEFCQRFGPEARDADTAPQRSGGALA
ncbi:MAG: exonuclease domain-containing protein [Planctomycetota bacterium]